MDAHRLNMFAGMIGGWELLLVLCVLFVLTLGVGALIAFAIWASAKNKGTKTPPSPPVPPTATPPPAPAPPVDRTVRLCKSCGTPMPPDAPQGLCPKCLMKIGLGTESGSQPAGSPKASSDNPPAPAEIATHFPQLEVLEILGQGGMGIVYKARQPHLDRFVALKILSAEASRDPAFAERFQREARALAKLNHPNIVAVFDFGQAGPYYFFLMEYVDGVNLAQLEHSRRLTPTEALVLVPKVCDALQYAHDEGVVHRDIKPGNILLDKKGRVKIADFGLAKLLGKATPDFTLTATGMTMGTPRYMAPEQMERPTEVDHRADIYSLGVVFYEMLTGELPMGRFALPSQKVQVDVRLDEVVLRSLERDVERRYQHASEVKTDVESITSSARAHSPPSSEPRSASGGLSFSGSSSFITEVTGLVRLEKDALVIEYQTTYEFIFEFFKTAPAEVRIPYDEIASIKVVRSVRGKWWDPGSWTITGTKLSTLAKVPTASGCEFEFWPSNDEEATVNRFLEIARQHSLNVVIEEWPRKKTGKAKETPPSPTLSASPSPGEAAPCTLTSQSSPASDFLLCNPRLPKMGQLICVFALVVGPLLWLLGFIDALNETARGLNFENVDGAKMTMEQAVQLRVYWGETKFHGVNLVTSLLASILLFIGGLKLRAATPSGVRLTLAGLAAELLLLPVMIVAAFFLFEDGGKDTGVSSWDLMSLFIGMVAYGFTVIAFVWLWRNRQKLNEILAATSPTGTPARSAATQSNRAFFWPITLATLLLIWLIPAALWNLGRLGCLLALVLTGVVFAALVRWRVQTDPAFTQAWMKLSPARQRTNLIAVAGFATAGYFFLFGALATRWEARPLNWNSTAESNEEFMTSHKGQEYKLIRQLSSFQDPVPQVELFENGGSWIGGWNFLGVFGNTGPHIRMFTWPSILCSLVVAFTCLTGAGTTCLSPPGKLRDSLDTMKLTLWRFALPMTAAAIFSTAGIYLLMIMGQTTAHSGPVEWLTSPLLTVKLDPAKTIAIFEEWAIRQSQVIGDRSVFELDAVPKGGKLGEVRLGQAWKASPFDRWHMTMHGPERITPHLVVKTISSAKPVETVVQITVGWPPKDPHVRQAWKAQLDSLATAIKAADTNGN